MLDTKKNPKTLKFPNALFGLDAGRPSASHRGVMKGKVCMVTGFTGGIGKVTARELAGMGATVVGVARDEARGKQAASEIEASVPGADVRLMVCDLSSQRDIRALAADAKRKLDRLDVLVNNAGAIFGARRLTVDDIEATFATNHLGYFLLTDLLLDLLRASAPARVVSVASEAHRTASLDLRDHSYERRRYTSMGAYCASKLANIAWSHELAHRLQGSRVTANSLHPGVIASGFGKDGPAWLRLGIKIIRPLIATPAKGAQTSLFLATAAEVEGVSGRYFKDKMPFAPSTAALDVQLRQKLWTVSEELTQRSRAAETAPTIESCGISRGLS